MADEGFKRKLAAILSANVAGYSHLMEDNEDATNRRHTSVFRGFNTEHQFRHGRRPKDIFEVVYKFQPPPTTR